MRKMIAIIVLAAVVLASLPAAGLSVQTKQQILDSRSAEELVAAASSAGKPAAVPTAVNLILGFGIGSFIQGDWVGGVLGLLGDAGGCALIATGATKANGALVRLASDGTISYNNEKSMAKVHEAFPYFVSGGSLLLVSRIWQTIAPSLYSARMNKAVVETLVQDKTFISLNPVSATPGMDVVVSPEQKFLFNPGEEDPASEEIIEENPDEILQ